MFRIYAKYDIDSLFRSVSECESFICFTLQDKESDFEIARVAASHFKIRRGRYVGPRFNTFEEAEAAVESLPIYRSFGKQAQLSICFV
ncbi:MAG: hypothetical protein AMXMBFR16_11510 [Candidatus Uhrbacteria bacterium]